ncbi:MAG: PEGA domain-containing protein, partial [Candidatus Omnitrophica bacterium]|nr:PEGA domain-containing protein [Candidatus Omnitrophota bacterium]
RIRAILFYLSLILFFILVPVILLYSFGYKLDVNRLRIIKTGLIYLKSIPDGAKVYLDGRHINNTTPVSIEGLMPGEYKLFLELENYYTWYQKILVESGKSTVLDRIILFPKKQHLDKINISDVDDFYVFPADKDYAYCISENNKSIFRIKLSPKEKEKELVCNQLQLTDNIQDLSLSPDKKKITYFYNNRLDVVYLFREKDDYQQLENSNFFIITDHRIINAFWYSDSEHIVIVTDKNIKIYELASKGKENIVTVLNINDKHPKVFYDVTEDVMYITDIQEGSDGKLYRGLYRLDLSKRFLFDFIKDIEENIK